MNNKICPRLKGSCLPSFAWCTNTGQCAMSRIVDQMDDISHVLKELTKSIKNIEKAGNAQ